MRSRAIGLWLLSALLVPLCLSAHAVGEDYVIFRFESDHIEGHFEIHVDDLRETLDLTIPDESDALKMALVAGEQRVRDYLVERFQVGPEGGEPYEIEFTRVDAIELPQGTFAQYFFRIDSGPLPDRLALHHSQFQDNDRLHRGLVLVEYNARTDTTYPDEYTALIFKASNREQVLDLTDVPAIMGPRDMIPQGILHIWIGIDHILFLLALMLPTVLVRRDGAWQPVESFREAGWNLLKIVTVFTIAHSVTLLLAALDFVSIPSRLVESVIAISIVLVALNNIFPKVREGVLWVILILGLFHGLGFASVMGHLPFRMVDLLWVVIYFNIGVEIGQVAIVAVVFPILFAIRKSPLYQPVVLKGLSFVLILIAGWWFVERALGLG